ncbi:MAG: hypothetical protein HQ526_00395 [Actinobacteria bacterium]|nr:hypothetical protein [Actinomycetota bacterium]
MKRWPSLEGRNELVRSTRSDLIYTLKALQSTTLVGDRVLLAGYVEWFEDVLEARELPLGFVPAALELLLSQIPESLALARCHAEFGLDVCRESAWQG